MGRCGASAVGKGLRSGIHAAGAIRERLKGRPPKPQRRLPPALRHSDRRAESSALRLKPLPLMRLRPLPLLREHSCHRPAAIHVPAAALADAVACSRRAPLAANPRLVFSPLYSNRHAGRTDGCRAWSASAGVLAVATTIANKSDARKWLFMMTPGDGRRRPASLSPSGRAGKMDSSSYGVSGRRRYCVTDRLEFHPDTTSQGDRHES